MDLGIKISLEIILWILFIYFTIYCIKNYIDANNVYYTCFMHLLLLLLTVVVYPSVTA